MLKGCRGLPRGIEGDRLGLWAGFGPEEGVLAEA